MSKKPKLKGALKHGAYSQQVILPGERSSDYDLMRFELYEEWAPDGLTERELVERLASLYWRLRRVHLYQQAKLQQRASVIRHNNEAISHRQALKKLAPEFAGATSVKAVEQALTQNERYRNVIMTWVPRDVSQDETKWGPAIADYLSKLKIEARKEGPDEFVELVDDPLEDLDWRKTDRIDEDIDRTIKRLVQVRTTKQLFPRKDPRLSPKMIDVSPKNDNGSASAVENEQTKGPPAAVEKITKPEWNKLVDYNAAVLRIT
jgi:hypothetical protein